MIKGRTQLQETGDIGVSINLTMSVNELEEIYLALDKGKTKYYGAAADLMAVLRATKERVNKVFIVYDLEGKPNVDQ